MTDLSRSMFINVEEYGKALVIEKLEKKIVTYGRLSHGAKSASEEVFYANAVASLQFAIEELLND